MLRRRLDLIRAVEGDDWSTVIDGQTAETVQPLTDEPAVAAAAAPLQPIESPFSHVNVHRAIGETCVGQCCHCHRAACSATRVGHLVGHHTGTCKEVRGSSAWLLLD